MRDVTLSIDEIAARIESGMTVGIGGWGSRRKPMALIRALLRSEARDLTLVSYGGPDVGLLAAAGKLRKVVYGFVSLDSIPLDPHFRAARQRGELKVAEYDEGMLLAGLRAAAARLPFHPTRAGLGSDVLHLNPDLRTVTSPYEDAQTLVAVPALNLDVALVHLNRADRHGNAQYLSAEPYFDDLFCAAARESYISCERIVPTEQLQQEPVQSLLVDRTRTTGVCEAPNGAHFTTCPPDYGRDEAFQRHYSRSAEPELWKAFHEQFLDGDEQQYQEAVAAFADQHAHDAERNGSAR